MSTAHTPLDTLTQPNTLRAIGYMMLSLAAFSLMNVFIRYASAELHTTVIVFWRNLFSVLLLLPFVLRSHVGWKTQRMRGHFFRGFIGIIGMQLWFYSITVLPLNEATALSFTAPLFTAIFAIAFLGEKAGVHRWTAIGLGFVGALIIIQPDTKQFDMDMWLVPCATSLWAIAGLLVKSLTKTEPPTRIVFYMASFMTLLGLPMALPFWQWPSPEMFALIGAIAVSSTIAHVFMVRAYAGADMVVLMPFDFFRMIFTAIFAYIAFDEVAGWNSWLGGVVIVGSAAYIAHREALVARRRKQAKNEASQTL